MKSFASVVSSLGALTVAVLGTLAVLPARAEMLSGNFGKTLIPDALQSGILLPFPTAPEIASLDRVALTLSHEWVGDLTIKIIPPSGSPFTLLDRLRLAQEPPDGSSAILGDFEFENGRGVLVPRTYEFAKTGADFAAAADLAVDTHAAPAVPFAEVYAAESWPAGPFAAGEWLLFLADNGEFSNGVITSAQLSFSVAAVPEPRMLLLALVPCAAIGLQRMWRVGKAKPSPRERLSIQ